jgi:hypothetical protein
MSITPGHVWHFSDFYNSLAIPDGRVKMIPHGYSHKKNRIYQRKKFLNHDLIAKLLVIW